MLALLAIAVAALAMSACGSDDSSSGGTTGGGTGATGGGEEIRAGWLWFGPLDDGGWNAAGTAGEAAAQEALGDSYSMVDADNVPFSEEAAQIAQQFINSSDSNVLVDYIGLGEIFADLCDANPDLYCIQTAPFTELGPNTTGFFAKLWVAEYVAGVAAGLSTETNTVGYVLAFDIPLITGAQNAFTMGCRSVNPDCEVRGVVTNDYFNPPKTAQAVSTLLDADSDVIRSYTDDQGYCEPVIERGALAIGEFWTNGEQCGDAALVSTVWNWESYFTEEFESIQNGEFVSEQLEFTDPVTGFSLVDWGPTVPAEVQEQVEQTFQDVASGEVNPFVGPINDNNGKERVASGEELSDEFLYGEWKWPVEGVISG